MHDQQTLRINQILKETQEENERNRKAMLKATMDQNAMDAQSKRDTDNKQRDDWNYQEQHDVNYTNTHDFMTENHATTQSMLAPHRYKPYHFKGLTPEHQAQIKLEREQQLKEIEMEKKRKSDEDKMWSLQQEHLRRMQILQDRDLQRQQRAVATATRSTQEQQDAELKNKWRDPYGDKP